MPTFGSARSATRNAPWPMIFSISMASESRWKRFWTAELVEDEVPKFYDRKFVTSVPRAMVYAKPLFVKEFHVGPT